MANAQLAKSIFSRTPDQETIVEDVYKKTSAETVNSFQDLTGTSTDLSNQFSFLSKYNSGQMLGGPTKEAAASMNDTIHAALPEGASKEKSLLSSMMGGLKSGAAGFRDTAKGAGNALKTGTQAYTQINGVVSAIKNGNLKDIRNITNTLNSITGKTSVLLSSNGAVGKIYGTVVDQASAAGISDAFGVVAGAVKENTAYVNKSNVLYQMASTSLPGALSRGDYMSVSSMASNLGDGVVGMMDPGAVKKLAANSRTPIPASQVKGQFISHQGAYKKIDPNWNKSSFQPAGSSTRLMDLSGLMGASKETKNLFVNGAKMSQDPSVKFYAALDSGLKVRSVEDSIRARYPMSTAANSTNMQKRDVDPRIVGVK